MDLKKYQTSRIRCSRGRTKHSYVLLSAVYDLHRYEPYYVFRCMFCRHPCVVYIADFWGED